MNVGESADTPKRLVRRRVQRWVANDRVEGTIIAHQQNDGGGGDEKSHVRDEVNIALFILGSV